MENNHYKIYAFILNTKVVKLAVLENNLQAPTLASELAIMEFGESAIAVNASQYPVNIGDLYIDNQFKHNTETGDLQILTQIPTLDERVSALELQIKSLIEKER